MMSPMFRFIAWLITGFWPSNSSLRALGKRLDTVEARLTTLTKKHNTLAGSYYADLEEPDPEPARRGVAPAARIGHPDFPDDEFNELLEARRRNGGVNA